MFPWADHERSLLQLADELYANDRVTDETWGELERRWATKEILDFVVWAAASGRVADPGIWMTGKATVQVVAEAGGAQGFPSAGLLLRLRGSAGHRVPGRCSAPSGHRFDQGPSRPLNV